MKRLSPWAVLFGVIAAWHLWRGAQADAFVFATFTTLLLLESFAPHRLGTHHRVMPQRRWVVLAAGALAVVAMATPRASAQTGVLVTLLGAVAFALTWYHRHARYNAQLSGPQRTSIRWWLGATLLLLLTEFAAYLGALATGDDNASPTITVLIDPGLSHSWVRGLFALGWVAVGWQLVSTKPSAR